MFRKVLRAKIGLHRLLGLGTKIAGCKTPGNFGFLPVLLHFCSPADTGPPKIEIFVRVGIAAYDSW